MTRWLGVASGNLTAVCPVPCASQTHGFKERKNYSTTGEVGMGDSWGALTVPYLLAKYVFPKMEHAGWTGLREAALLEKCRPFALELRANWARLKASQGNPCQPKII